MSNIPAGVRVGCAGWTISKPHQEEFPSSGTHLQRYSQRFSAVEINSSFYRAHRRTTYARWADETPDDFQFSIKLPKTITHEARLEDTSGLHAFHHETSALGNKLGPWLVQLPPSLEFVRLVASEFFAALRQVFNGPVVCEPRHATWFSDEAHAVLHAFAIARVAADPVRHELDGKPGGSPEIIYYRLHGSPRIYYSEYSAEYLERLATDLATAAETPSQVWCIFDNTALGAATSNALQFMHLLSNRTHAAT